MWSKFYFGAVVLFFLLMNALLWRSVLGDKDLSLSVPVDSVLRRLLESADDSNLEIRHHGIKTGYCHWSASIRTSSSNPAMPEGMVASISSYAIDFDGTLMVDKLNRLRFRFSLDLDTKHVWREMQLHLALRPSIIDLHLRSTAAEKKIVLAISEGQDQRELSFGFDDLRHPERILAALGSGRIPESVAALGLPMASASATHPPGPSPTALPITWKARTGRHQIGHSSVPVYQLHASLFDTYPLVLSILESGEILRVELPGNWVLVNADLLSL